MQPTNLNLKAIARDATLRGDTKTLFHALDLLEREVPIATFMDFCTELDELRLQGVRPRPHWLDSGQGRRYIPAMPRRSSKKDTPAKLAGRIKLAGRMKRRWRVVLLRHKGEILGTVEALDVAAAKAAAAIQFDLDEIQRNRIMVQELGWGVGEPGTMPGEAAVENAITRRRTTARDRARRLAQALWSCVRALHWPDRRDR